MDAFITIIGAIIFGVVITLKDSRSFSEIIESILRNK